MPITVSTQEKLLHFGKQEFLAHGFANASLRNIAKEAGVTTGAIYGYFKDKNALFEAIVEDVYTEALQVFCQFSEEFSANEDLRKSFNVQQTVSGLEVIFKFIYANIDELRLLVCCAEGSGKVGFIDELIDYETEHTVLYLSELGKIHKLDFEINPTSIHILSDSYINSLFEPIRHGMSYGEAIKHVRFLGEFYTGGWENLLKLM